MLYNLFKRQEAFSKERSFDNAVMFSPTTIKRQHIFGNDLFNWTDVLQQNPNFVGVYYSPDFPINRALFRGYLIPTESHFLDQLYSPTLPWYNRDLLEVKEIEILPDGTIHTELLNQKTITPDVFFAWQGGLFDGNMLKFRMLRNLSKKLSMNAFVSYSDLKRMIYYHGGGMADMYLDFYNRDSTKTSVFGYNPYSLLNRSGMELNYRSKISANLRYSYSDIRQDLAYHTDSTLRNNDTLKLSIAYNEHNTFLHQLNGGLDIPLGEKFLWRNLGKLESVYQSERPLSLSKNSKFVTERSQQNNTLQSAGSQLFFAPVLSDSISIQVAANRYAQETENTIDLVSHHTKVLLENKFISPNFDKITLTTNGGVEFLRANGSEITAFPSWNLDGNFKFNNLKTQFYFKRDKNPWSDFSGIIDEYYWYDMPFYYHLFGANLYYQFSVASIHLGYSMMDDNAYDEKLWHNKETPYRSPSQAFSFGGNLGQIGPFSMFSNWIINDEMPYFKSFSGLRLHFNREGRVRHFYTDITYNYWSKREYTFGKFIESLDDYYYYNENSRTIRTSPSYYRIIGSFGDYEHWNRSIHDISLKFAAEIETFRIFWKIDNILNRTNSYIPGYIMPGLIFRWGFSWNIMG